MFGLGCFLTFIVATAIFVAGIVSLVGWIFGGS